METSLLVAVISVIGTVIAAIVAFLGNRKGTLANAEKNFRDAILQQNTSLRDRVDELEDENQELKRKVLKLEAALIKAGMVIDHEEPAG